mgnify:CR=1 FL=1
MYTRIIKSSNKYEKRPVFNKSIFYAKTEDIVYGLVGYLINEDYIDKNILYKNLENNENDISTILYNKNSINIQFNNQKQLSKETVSNKEIKFEEIKFKVVNNNNQESIINFLKSKGI